MNIIDDRERLPSFFRLMMGQWSPHIGEGFASADDFIRDMAKADLAGIAASKVLPFLAPAGLLPRLVHRSALRAAALQARYCRIAGVAWGVGNIMGSHLDKQEAEYDLAAILALWCDAIDHDLFSAIVKDLNTIEGGYLAPYGAQVITLWLNDAAASTVRDKMQPAAGKLAAKMISDVNTGVLIQRLLSKILPNLTDQVASDRLRQIMPLAGTAATVAAERRRIKSVGRCAKTYYSAKLAAMQ